MVLLFDMRTSHLTVKGQVTVPKEMRDAFGWKAYTEVQFELLEDGVKLTRPAKAASRGARIVERLRGKGNRKLKTEQIMSMTRGDE